MKKVLFIGSSDKSKVLLNLINVVSNTGLKSLHIDGSTSSYLNHVVPDIGGKLNKIEFSGFDCALNHRTLNEVKTAGYDYVQVETDSSTFLEGASLKEFDHIYIITSFDRSDLSKTKALVDEIIAAQEKATYLMKLIIHPYVSTHMDEDYVYDFLNNDYILRSDDFYTFEFNELDYLRAVENSHSEKVNLKKYSRGYRKTLESLISDIEPTSSKEVASAFSKARRG